MIVLPNPFMNSADDTPSVESAAAPIDQPRSAAAVPIAESFTTMEVHQEAPAAAVSPVDAGATDCIGDLLRYASMPFDPDYARCFPHGFDPHIFMDTLEAIVEAIDPVPEFLTRRRA